MLLALKNVAEARRSKASTPNESDANWETCYQLLSQGELPGILLISKLLNSLGLKPSVTVKDGASRIAFGRHTI
jgi:DNA-binding phage protein